MTSSPESLDRLMADEWQWRLSEDPFLATMVGDDRYNQRVPDVSEAAEARRAAGLEGWLERLRAIDPAGLAPRERLNHSLLIRDLEERLALAGFGAYRLPLAKISGPHSFLPDLLLMTPFRHAQDYAAYIERLGGFGAYLDGNMALMRAGMNSGWVQARAALEGVETPLRALLVGDPIESVFYQPFRNFPAALPEADRPALAQAGQNVLRDVVIPAFRRFLAFVEQEYLPAAREADGISALPGGSDYYAFLVRKYTTLELTPEEIHQTGLAEVARIRAEMQAVMAEVGFDGSLRAFIDFLRADPRFYVTRPEDLMKEVALLMKRMEGELPRLFKTLPRTPFGLREVPAHIAPHTTTAYYFPATGDGTTAGYYYVNTYDLPSRPLYEYEALSFHEAVPGHHLQLALQQEMQDVPDFRRYLMVDAFIEGWALYAERLGLEVGFYQDPYSNFGRLIYEMWRATRLVVDTGIHQLGWTRQAAIDYMADNTALSLLNIQNEVDRYIAWPGQALAYKMGELKVRALRAGAEQALGPRFDVRSFHEALLEEGAIPLSTLEAKISAWVAARAQAEPM